jgi:hypothetical protein
LIDDISYVDGSNAAVGFNFVRNGDFETPFFEENPVTNSWVIGTNYFTNSTISTSLVHSGNGALADGLRPRGSALNLFDLSKIFRSAPHERPTMHAELLVLGHRTRATNISMRIQNSATLSTNVNINVQDHPVQLHAGASASARRS